MGSLNSEKIRQQALRGRVSAIKSSLPANYKHIVISHYAQYDTMRGSALMENVKKGTSTDATLTEIYERIAAGKLKLKISPYEIVDS